MTSEKGNLLCYNRGCGQTFDPTRNADGKRLWFEIFSIGAHELFICLFLDEDSCRHHPGQPFFHDAYKGWSCCNKKCTDFTEFLNIKGCTLSKHSNEKPPEPEKPPQNNIPDTEVIEVKPIVAPSLKRPPFDTPLVSSYCDCHYSVLYVDAAITTKRGLFQ